jgi:hypothetical protein
MSDQLDQVFPVSPTRLEGKLIPALKGCLNCQTIEMIASPELGICPGCGATMTVLSASAFDRRETT